MACPACGAAMDVRSVAGVTVDVCGRCAGVWLDRGELTRVLEARKAERQAAGLRAAAPGTARGCEPAQRTAARPCLRCSAPMTQRPFGGAAVVVVDVCATHGVFLYG